jgi:hypothetical protein
MAAYPLVDRSRLNMGNDNYLDIFYPYIRGLRANSVEIFNNVRFLDLKIVCLTETWLNEPFSSQNSLKCTLYIVLIETVVLNYVANEV